MVETATAIWVAETAVEATGAGRRDRGSKVRQGQQGATGAGRAMGVMLAASPASRSSVATRPPPCSVLSVATPTPRALPPCARSHPIGSLVQASMSRQLECERVGASRRRARSVGTRSPRGGNEWSKRRGSVREGEEVDCSRMAARSAGTLRHMIDDTAEGICPVDVPVVVLRVILDACNHDDSGFSRMASHSLEELVAVMVSANFIDAPGAFSAAARQLNNRFLAGKSVEELHTNLGAENDCASVPMRTLPHYTPNL